MRSKGLILGVTLAGLMVCGSARANFFGSMTGLMPRQTKGLEMVGGYVGFGSHEVGGFGQVRLGIGNPKIDVGAEGGFSHYSVGGFSQNYGGGQVDVKGVLFDPSATNQNIHIGGDAALFFSKGGGDKTIGFTAIPAISAATVTSSGSRVEGWAGLGLIWEHNSYDASITVDAPARPFGGSLLRPAADEFDVSGSSNDSAALLQLGASYDFQPSIGVGAEFRHAFSEGAGSDFMVGINYWPGAAK